VDKHIPISSLQRCWLIALLFSLGISGCQKRPSCESVEATATAATKTIATPIPLALGEIELRWEAGVHAQTYVVDEKGTNSSCAQCHAPIEWQPLSSELPPSWVQAGLKGLSVPAAIAEATWPGVACEVCHPQPRDQITGEIGWLSIPSKSMYEEMDTSTRLCQTCHLPDPGGDHTALVFEGVHSELTCTDCHDAHNGSASCGTTTCHQPFAEECEVIETHDKPHREVTCSGCHDGLGFPIGWNEERGKWDTFNGGDPLIEGQAKAFSSHALVLEVDCDRCHAPGDHPWDP
jgi:hypothetical protein